MSVETPPRNKKNESLDDVDMSWLRSETNETEHGAEPRTKISLGHRAVDTLVRMPADKLKTAYNSEYGQKIVGMARGATGEVAKAAALSGVKTLGENLGISYENGSLQIRKMKLAAAALRLYRNPYGEIARVAKSTGQEALKSGKKEARHQATYAGRTVANDTFDYLNRRTAA